MPKERTSMRTIKAVLQLKFESHLSQQKIAGSSILVWHPVTSFEKGQQSKGILAVASGSGRCSA